MSNIDPQMAQQIVQFLVTYGTPAGIAAAQTIGTSTAQALGSGATKAIQSLWGKIRHKSEQEGRLAEKAVTAFEAAPHDTEHQQTLLSIIKLLCSDDPAFANEISQLFNEVQHDPVAVQFIQHITGNAQVGMAGVNYGPVTIHQTTHQSLDNEEEFNKLRDEIERRSKADILLLKADKFATSLPERIELVNEAVELWPSYKQERFRQLGIEISKAVIDGYDPIIQKGMIIAGLGRGMPGYWKLEHDEIVWLSTRAISYLRENVLDTTTPDGEGLLYLACMYGYQQQFDNMMSTIDKAIQIDGEIKQSFQQRKILLTLTRACSSDQVKLDRVRERLGIPPTSKLSFCKFIQDFDYTDFHGYIYWLAIKRPSAAGERGTFLLMITPPYEQYQGQVRASAQSVESWQIETVADGYFLNISELYDALDAAFFLTCHLSES